MIDDRMQEQAALHVLGALTDAEAAEFKSEMQSNPELAEYTARLTKASGAVAGEIKTIRPPAGLRDKILAQINPPIQVVPAPVAAAKNFGWLPWSIAALLVILCALLGGHDIALRNNAAERNQDLAGYKTSLETLRAENTDLQAKVIRLQEGSHLTGLRMSLLHSPWPDGAKVIGVSLWDQRSQSGRFLVENLPVPSGDHAYQLWVLDGGKTPVNAGVFNVDAQGRGNFEFKVQREVQTAGKFAVTEESKNGAAAPTLKNLVLIGG